ncbi:copper-binding protein [Pararhodobacter sp.]|uniref:copper-binding protein n=1 Tax=Pararhodobacter sp. TaxID=2127056 RepID=UPI002AFEC7F2|nr:copper-binding protein [Pararhodobacter sp.]
MKPTKTLTLAVAFAALALPGFADTFVNGVIEAIDTDRGRLTINHEPLVDLDMEAMTMVFRLAEPTMIDGLTVGQTIQFVPGRVNGRLTVVQLRNGS